MRNLKTRKCPYIDHFGLKWKNKTTLFCHTFKVEEKKVDLFFHLKRKQARYKHFYVLKFFCSQAFSLSYLYNLSTWGGAGEQLSWNYSLEGNNNLHPLWDYQFKTPPVGTDYLCPTTAIFLYPCSNLMNQYRTQFVIEKIYFDFYKSVSILIWHLRRFLLCFNL